MTKVNFSREEVRRDRFFFFSMRATIVMMLKAPRLGEVKTRLARSVGEEEALRIYLQLVEHQLSRLPQGWEVEIHYAPQEAYGEMVGWLGKGYGYFAQRGRDLGERLVHAMGLVFERGKGPVLFLGGDCPGVGRDCLEEAVCGLEGNEVVVGPSCDGGYYLLGLREPCACLFEGIDWGTEKVLEQTLKRVEQQGWRARHLGVLEDVDVWEDWERACQLFSCFSRIS